MNNQARPGALRLRLGKCWQAVTPQVCWQVAPGGGEPAWLGPKKLFLMIHCEQAHRQIVLQPAKQVQVKVGGVVSALLRKHVGSGCIYDLLLTPRDGSLWLPIHQHGAASPQWFLRLDQGKPPVLSLFTATGDEIFRFGQGGTFTKRRHNPLALDTLQQDSEVQSLWSQLFTDLRAQAAAPVVSSERCAPQVAAVVALQRQLRQKVKRRLKVVQKSHARQQVQIPSEAVIADLRQQAYWLQEYAYLVVPAAKELWLTPVQTGGQEPVCIPLDPERSVGRNLERYFTRMKKAAKARQMGLVRLEAVAADLQQLTADLTSLQADVEPAQLKSLGERYGLDLRQPSSPAGRARSGDDGVGKPYYLAGVSYRVGRKPQENDQLTRSARSNDYWFHLQGGGGAHVVLMCKSLPGLELSVSAKRAGAILAIHYSAKRQDQAGEVYVTQRRHLRKPRGLAPGQWLVDKAETLFVRYTQAELQAILGQAA